MSDNKTQQANLNSFSDSDEAALEQLSRRGGSKLAAKSQFAKKTDQKESFEDQANAAYQSIQSRKQRATDLVLQFSKIIKDTTLETNKGPIDKSIEAECYRNLLGIAEELNNDVSEKEGSGSIALVALLLKTTFHFRNSNNEISFEIAKLNKQVAILTQQLELLSSREESHGK